MRYFHLALLCLIAVGASLRALPAQQTLPVALANPGFEEGGQGWVLPPNGAVVEEQAFAGKHSARLVVRDPRTDAVYITRQVPVEGGATYSVRCRVKTAGVQETAGRMSSVGAGLIVEWADRKGKWYAAGQYATGLYGDHDWTARQIPAVRAPEEAGFATIFLALRGAGTAWFDDVEVTRVVHTLTAEEPAAGRTLRNNHPLLRWREDPQAQRYVVELSPDATFPPGKTQRWPSEEPLLRVPDKLPAGKWYWRVSAPGYDPTEPRSFEQTARVEDDATPPVVDAPPARVTRPEQAVPLTVRDDGPRPPRVTAEMAGQPLAVQVRPADKGEYQASLSGRWQPGLNRVTVTATDAVGNSESATFWVLCRPVPAHPVAISAEGVYTVDGKPHFPFGIYQVLPQSMARVKAAGFEVVHSYEFEGSRDDERAVKYLDAAAAAGLRVFIGFDRGARSQQGLVQGNAEHVMQRVAALCAHPGLFCWYLFDEPEVTGQYLSPRGLTRYADLIRRLDPYHPVVVTTWGPRMALYRPSFDTHWTQAYTTPAGVVKQIEEHRALLGPACPITLLVHAYDRDQTELLRKGRPVDIGKFQPDGDWLRAAAFAGLTQRVNGLWWWWYAAESKEYVSIAQAPQAWQALAGVLSRIRELEPVLVHPAKAETGSLPLAGGNLYWWRKRIGAETTLIAVNTAEAAGRASVPAPGAGAAEVLFEGRSLQGANDALTDEFARYAVHVYRYRE